VWDEGLVVGSKFRRTKKLVVKGLCGERNSDKAAKLSWEN
jgi:hypothetical protein